MPIVQSGAVIGVLVVQNMTRRQFFDEEVEVLQTVAMVLSEMMAAVEADADDDEAPITPRFYEGLGLSEGMAMGHVVLHEPRVEVARLIADDPDEEIERLEAALYKLRRNVDELLRTDDVSHAGEHLDVLETYRMFANDRGWLRRMRAAIRNGLTAEAAVERVNNDMRARLTGQRDIYLRARLHDFEDLSNRLLRILTGRAATASDEKLPRDTILVARTLGPAELLDYDRRKLRGLVLEEGALGAHVTIVARALNLPLVGGVKGIAAEAAEGQEIILDADQAEVHVNPPTDIAAVYANRARLRARRLKRYTRLRGVPAVSRDGVNVRLDMNAGLMVDVENLAECGAENIGLFRTELQFMISARLPRVAEQQQFYEKVLAQVRGREVIFRTLDIGGDKILPYLRTAQEENPALGWRSLRVALDRPGLMRYQLRALLRAAAGQPLSVMFPLVTTVAEFRAARALLDREYALAEKAGRKLPKTLSVGAMLEVPALAWQLDALLPLVDFLAVGTNDLMQFFFASDRSNPRLSSRYDLLSAPALGLLAHVCETCTHKGVPVSVCGEAGARPLEAMALLGLGFERFSMPSASVGPVKRMIRSANVARLRAAVADLRAAAPEDMRGGLQQIADGQGIKL